MYGYKYLFLEKSIETFITNLNIKIQKPWQEHDIRDDNLYHYVVGIFILHTILRRA
jgi:hypothetical protein